jgi:hypothetical protein
MNENQVATGEEAERLREGLRKPECRRNKGIDRRTSQNDAIEGRTEG